MDILFSCKIDWVIKQSFSPESISFLDQIWDNIFIYFLKKTTYLVSDQKIKKIYLFIIDLEGQIEFYVYEKNYYKLCLIGDVIDNFIYLSKDLLSLRIVLSFLALGFDSRGAISPSDM